MLTAGAVMGPWACNGSLGRACDQEALRAAADATDAMLKAWDPRAGKLPDYPKVARAIEGACPGLPEGFRGYFALSVQPQPDRSSQEFPQVKPLRDDSEGMRPMRAHCPDHARIADSMGLLPASERLPAMYDGCKFAELGLIDRAEIRDTMSDPQAHHAHALLLWLVDRGAPIEVTRALVRPILAATDTQLEVARDVKLPASAGGAALSGDDPTLHVTPHQMTLDGSRLVNLKGGVFDEPDFHPSFLVGTFASRRELAGSGDQPPPSRLTLAADVSLRWGTLGPVLQAAMRAGYTEISVAALAPTPLRPLVGVPLVTAGPSPTVSLALSPTQIELRCGEHEASPDITTLAAELARCPGTLRLAVTEDTGLARVVALLGALAGTRAVVELAAPL